VADEAKGRLALALQTVADALTAGDVGTVQALNILSGLLDLALTVLDVTVDDSTPIEARAITLPHTTTPLPALHLTVDDVPVPTQ
jgi:hypothetical protein